MSETTEEALSACATCMSTAEPVRDIVSRWLDSKFQDDIPTVRYRVKPDLEAHQEPDEVTGAEVELSYRTEDEAWVARWKAYCDNSCWGLLYADAHLVHVHHTHHPDGHRASEQLIELEVTTGAGWAQLIAPVGLGTPFVPSYPNLQPALTGKLDGEEVAA